MVDRPARERIATAIASYLEGSIDNFALDDLLFDTPTEDELCRNIAQQMWYFYCDMRRHYCAGRDRLLPQYEAMIKRWLALLRTDEEIPAFTSDHRQSRQAGKSWRDRFLQPFRSLRAIIRLQRPAFAENEFWPFAGESDWIRVEHAVSETPNE